MPTLPRQTDNTAFSTGAYSTSSARRHPLPAPVIPAKSPRVPPAREPVQAPGKHLKSLLPLLGYVVLAMVVVSIGLAYISGYMLVMKERNRAGSLQKFLKQEDDIKTRNQELMARLESKHHIEAMATQNNMIHAGDRPRYTIGMTTSFSAQIQNLQSDSPPSFTAETGDSGETTRSEIDRAGMRKTSQQ